MQELEYSNIGATELVLSNGMQICYKRTDFLDDQVPILLGIAYQIYHASYFIIDIDLLLYQSGYIIDLQLASDFVKLYGMTLIEYNYDI